MAYFTSAESEGEMNYKGEMIKAMNLLAEDERVIFLGQTVLYEGSTIYETLTDVPDNKKVEMPVAEELQMGVSIGLSLLGYVPVSVYPRMDFLMRAMDQLVNHLDKIEEMSDGQFKPKVLIRTVIGGTKPLDPGPQHHQDHTSLLRIALPHVKVFKLVSPAQIVPTYKMCLKAPHSSILVEYAEKIRD